MQIIHILNVLREAIARFRAEGKRIALVPTMGALHDGHMALVEQAKREADEVVVSIFVNPTQFGPNEDLTSYPRREEQDTALLARAGVAILWMPSVAEMYPDGFATTITAGSLGNFLCGAARPGHFDGVATVVAKLFNQVRPDAAIFGEKDWQQLAVIRRMARDLNFPLSIIGVPTKRDADGLALSSRNAYLSGEERAAAVALPRALKRAVSALECGTRVAEALGEARTALEDAGFSSIDYIELVDAVTLKPVATLDRKARLLAAARIGGTRLIDNFAVLSKKPDRR